LLNLYPFVGATHGELTNENVYGRVIKCVVLRLRKGVRKPLGSRNGHSLFGKREGQ